MNCCGEKLYPDFFYIIKNNIIIIIGAIISAVVTTVTTLCTGNKDLAFISLSIVPFIIADLSLKYKNLKRKNYFFDKIREHNEKYHTSAPEEHENGVLIIKEKKSFFNPVYENCLKNIEEIKQIKKLKKTNSEFKNKFNVVDVFDGVLNFYIYAYIDEKYTYYIVDVDGGRWSGPI